MPSSIDVGFVEQFRSNVYHKSQQHGSRLGNLVHYEPLVGDVHHFDLLDADDAQTQTRTNAGDRHADSPVLDAPHEKVRVSPVDSEWGDLIDREDKLRMLLDPESEYIKLAYDSLGRQKDDQIITAFEANVDLKNTSGGAYTSTDFATHGGQSIANGGTGLTLDKILEGIENLQDSEAFDEDEIVIVYGPRQERDVRQISQLVSSDFVSTGGMMARGIAGGSGAQPRNGPLGLTWVRSARLPVSTNIRSCYMYARRAMAIAVNEDMYSFVMPRPDKKGAWQVYCRQTLGAVRREGAGVVKIDCDES